MIGNNSSRNRIVRSIALVGGVLAASLVALAPAAEAGVARGSVEVQRSDHGHRKHHGVRYATIPRRVHGEHWREIRHRYGGHVYYRPHHHFHKIYRFPVVVGSVVTYRPYYYCDDQLFVTASVPLPRVVIGLNVTSGPIYR